MNFLSSSYSRHPASHTPLPHHPHTLHHRGYHDTTPSQLDRFFSPLVTWTMFLGIVFSVVLVFSFCTTPFTPANLFSDFYAGVEGVRELFHQQSVQTPYKINL